MSVLRERVGQALLVLTAFVVTAYWYNTRDASIRKRATEYLGTITAGEVQVGRARFTMFGGITLYDVRVAAPFDSELDPQAVNREDREVFSAGSVTLLHNPWRLLLGGWQIDRIVVTQPTISLVHNPDTGARNWRRLFASSEPRRPSVPAHRPQITMRSARVYVSSLETGGHRESDLEELDADIRPHPTVPTAYCIELRRLGAPPERTTVVFDPDNSLVTNAPFIDARTIRLQLPRPYQRFFEAIALEGDVKLDRINYAQDAHEGRHDVVELRAVRCVIPVDLWTTGEAASASSAPRGESPPGGPTPAEPTGAPAAEANHTFQVTDVHGVMDLAARCLRVNLTGRINGATCTITGSIDQVDRPLGEMDLDLTFRCNRLPMPQGTLRAHLSTDPTVHELLRRFFADYDPQGDFDLDFRVRRDDGALQFNGVLSPVDASASCRYFPYRVEGLRGHVHFEEGHIRLEHLTGTHEDAQIVITGLLDRSPEFRHALLEINAENLPFDPPLLEALPERYAELLRRFDLRGACDASIRLIRSTGDDGHAHWTPMIDGSLRHARTCFRGFPYSLEQVTGRLHIESDQVEIVGLTGRHGSTIVRFDGKASVAPDAAYLANVDMTAQSLALDGDLVAAFDEPLRRRLQGLNLEGSVNLQGRLAIHARAEQSDFDLAAECFGVGLSIDGLPGRLEGLRGRLTLSPEELSIEELTGRYGAAELSIIGQINGFAQEGDADVVVTARDLVLDQDLHDRLPQGIKAVWNDLRPQGRLHLTTRIHTSGRGEARRGRHSTEIEAVDLRLCYGAFPLTISGVSGNARITDDALEIIAFDGKAADGTIRLAGTIDLTDPGRRGALLVRAQDMAFNPELIAALPEELRRAVGAFAPRGRFDLLLESLRFETDGAGETTWSFQGSMTLNGVAARMGVELADAHGLIVGTGEILPKAHASFSGTARFDRMTLSKWPVQNLHAEMVVDPETDALLIRDASADACGGQAMGFAEVLFRPGHNEYSLNITVRDAQLDDVLRAQRPARAAANEDARRDGEAREKARGALYGNFLLRGRVGRGDYREGVGELSLRDAQVWKMPLALAVFQVLNLAPDENVFHDGRCRFYLNDDVITLGLIDLQGKAMSFVGGGRLDLRTDQLDVTLLAGSPVRLRLPFLTEIMEGAARELMEIRLTGPPHKPQIKPQPLRSLKMAMDTLFPEPPKSQGGLDRDHRFEP